eukprot:9336067-Prorocentrum_lima.AAC.1
MAFVRSALGPRGMAPAPERNVVGGIVLSACVYCLCSGDTEPEDSSIAAELCDETGYGQHCNAEDERCEKLLV